MNTILLASLLITHPALNNPQVAKTTPSVKAAFATEPVSVDADDPAIFLDRKSPKNSVIIGTDKSKKPQGGLFVFDLKGKTIQKFTGLDRPNNVDVAYGLSTPAGKIDLAVTTERYAKQLRIFRINSSSTTKLEDVTGTTAVFAGEKNEDGEPMGIVCVTIAGKTYAFVTPKAGPLKKHAAQYELTYNSATKKVDAKLTRRFGLFSGVKETESMAFDNFSKNVIYSDETVGTRIYSGLPLAADTENKFFNRTGTKGDHEGIAIWESDTKGNGWIVCTDQIEANSIYRLFDRKTQAFVGEFSGGADATDGIEISSELGIMVAMNSKDKNFLVYRLSDIATALKLKTSIKPLIRL